MLKLYRVFSFLSELMSIISIILLLISIALLGLCITLAYFYYSIYDKNQTLIKHLLSISNVVKAVRYGDLTKRITGCNEDQSNEIFENINRMVESIEDRELIVKSYQKELQDQKEYLESVFNSLSDGVIIISNDASIEKVNPAIINWLEMKESDITGKNFFDFFKCTCSKCALNECSAKENGEDHLCLSYSPQNILMPSEVMLINDYSKTDRHFGVSFCRLSGYKDTGSYVVSLRDITKIKELDKIRVDFVATLTHDLKVPILAEATTLKLLSKGMLGELKGKQKEAIDNMLYSNNDLLMLVNSLLDTYKFEAGQSKLVILPTDVSKMLDECVAEFSLSAKRNNQQLKSSIPSDLPFVEMDRKEVKRVIKNLISNALNYTPKGGKITVSAEIDEKCLTVQVKDNGKGIRYEDLESIFDRFFSTAKKFRKVGTGLGLYLSRQIIEKHNGKIWANSTLGKGSTFYFTIPLSNS